jgi:DNA polymerase-3 subunit gamma/tau
MTKALYRKWRPLGWDEVTAQDHVIQTLRNAVLNDRVAHAYLFAGPRGTGKTTSARLLAKAVNCLEDDLSNRPCNTCEHCLAINAGRFLDLIEIDAASNTSVDDARDLREKPNFSPSKGRYKVYIIDEVHMLSTAAFNALLKTLEEPPPHAIFILATTEIHKIPATVLSRCQRHEFRRIPIKNMVVYMKEKSQAEGIDVEDSVFTEVARQATGSLRDAISLLDQLTSASEHITLEMAQNVLGTATSLRVIDVISALLEKDTAQGLALIDGSLDNGTDPRQFARQIVTYLRNVLMFKMGNPDQIEAGETVKEKLIEHAAQFSMPDLLKAIESFNLATTEELSSWHPGLGLELAFTHFLTEPEPTPAAISQPDALQVSPRPQPVEADTLESPSKKEPQASKAPPKAAATPKKQDKPAEQKAPADQKQDLTPPETPVKSESLPAQPGAEISLAALQQAWPRIRTMVKKHNPRTEGLLNTSKIAGIKGNTLILGFSSDLLKEMMEKEGNINLTMDIIEEVFGQPMLIECIVSTHEGGQIPENIKIDQDGMVGTATRDLGGRISSAVEE